MTKHTWEHVLRVVRTRAAIACTIGAVGVGSAGCAEEPGVSELLEQLAEDDAQGRQPPGPQTCTTEAGASGSANGSQGNQGRRKQWRAPALIEGLSGDASLPQIAVNAAGGALLAWVQSDGTTSQLAGNAYIASSGWQAATVVTPGSRSVGEPAVALDGAGRGLFVWREDPSVDLRTGASATWSQATGYGTPTRIFEFDPRPWASFGPRLTAHPDGQAFAVWGYAAGRGGATSGHRYDPATGWGPGVALVLDPMPTGVVVAFDPGLAFGPEGRVFTSYAFIRPGFGRRAWTNISTSDTPAGTAYSLDDDPAFPGNAETPQVAADACGNAVAVWLLRQPSQDLIVSAHYVAGTGWTGPLTVQATPSTGSALPGEPRARSIFTSDGRACAAWLRSEPSRTNVWASCFNGSAWEPPVNIDQRSNGVSDGLQIAADGLGGLAAIWARATGTERHVYASHYAAGRRWSASRRLDTSGTEVRSPAIGLDAAGNGFAVWTQSDGTDTNVIVSRYD